MDILRLGPNPDAPWAIFDPAWYKHTYNTELPPEVSSSDELLSFYIHLGQSLGHSPNALFDEQWYLATYPSVADGIKAGALTSGYEHYCREGFQKFSPHWLFDVAFYANSNKDLDPERLKREGIINHYAHFLKYGAREGRIAHKFFWPNFYTGGLDPAQRQEALDKGSFQHFLRSPVAGDSESKTTPYFDPAWYRDTYPEVARQIAQGAYRSALHHFLVNDAPTTFDPLPIFSERVYLLRNTDVAQAVQNKTIRSGYHHFIKDGANEGRIFNRAVSLTRYVEANSLVRADLQRNKTLNPFTHLLTVGVALGLSSSPASHEDYGSNEDQAKVLFRREAEIVSLLYSRHSIDFTVIGQPLVSVIVVVHNRFALTLASLASLRDNFAEAIELILVDSGSTDEIKRISQYVKGAKILRFEDNLGFVRACNAGLAQVTADTVIYMNNDIRLAPRAVTAALERLRSSRRIGAVGGKIIRSHGGLQEAGCIVWRDGYTLGYLRDHSPFAPEANFVRNVDYCSAVFLAVPSALLKMLGGFDDDYAPSYYEDTDLCVRISRLGFRVLYDPAVVIHHLEYGSAQSADDAESAMARGRTIFLEKQAEWLATRFENQPEIITSARFSSNTSHRLLFIDDTIPIRGIGSGFVRANDIIREMAALDISVTIFPLNKSKAPLVTTYSDIPDTVEVMHNQTIDGLEEFLSDRQNYFNTIWVSRTHNLDLIIGVLKASLAPSDKFPRLIYDTEAVTSLRNAAKSNILSPKSDFDFLSELHKEFKNAHVADTIVCVNGLEKFILNKQEFKSIAVLGHCNDIRLTPRPFAERSGLLFIGAMHEINTPNYDSLCWFIDFVMPFIVEQLGTEARLTIAGYTDNGASFERFRDNDHVILRGAVPNIESLYNEHRIFVAPTRYAAGIPYKIHEAASFGLPIVATNLLGLQISWNNGDELLTADISEPEKFASHIASLYHDSSLWHRLRNGAARRISKENSREAYRASIKALVLD